MANGLDSGDELRSLDSQWNVGGQIGQSGGPAFRWPRCAGLRCARRSSGRNRAVPSAIETADQALTLAQARNDAALAHAIEQRRTSTARACPIANPLPAASLAGRAAPPPRQSAAAAAHTAAAPVASAQILRRVFGGLGGLALERVAASSFGVGRHVRRGHRASDHRLAAERPCRRRGPPPDGTAPRPPGGRFGAFTSAAAGAASFGLTLRAGGGGGACPSSSWPESTSM